MEPHTVQGIIDLFVTMFIGMGPVKSLLIYLAATRDTDVKLQRLVARKTVLTATTVALVLLVAGSFLMRLLHFTTGSLTIAGGLILLLLALQMVMSPPPAADKAAQPVGDKALLSMAVFPLALPLTLNPVGIVTLTVTSAEATSFGDIAILAVIVLVIALIDYAIFVTGHGLDHVLSPERILVSEKVLGILLAALAVQLIYNGLADLGVVAAIAH
ncbi:MAG TPA: MarC family protein [Ktedonobacterales bacterium]